MPIKKQYKHLNSIQSNSFCHFPELNAPNYFSFSQNPSEDEDEEDLIEDQPDSFDSFKIVKRKGKKHFCKCKRGPMGHPGAPGIEGTCQNANTFGFTIVDSIFI